MADLIELAERLSKLAEKRAASGKDWWAYIQFCDDYADTIIAALRARTKDHG